MSIAKKAKKMIGKTVNLVTSSVSQTSNKRNKTVYPEIEGLKNVCLSAAEESFVLLKNDGNVLPVSPESTVSVFGRVQLNTFFVGYGSGGDVNAHYTVSFIDGIRKNSDLRLNEELAGIYKKWVAANPPDNGFWGHWPMCYDEMHVNEAIAKRASELSDTAVVFIGRAAGEDRENTLTKGSFYLTDEEENMLWCVRKYFSKTAVILNIGNIIDFSWVEKYDIPCVGICWQGGMETGNAVANILSGKAVPSGKLTDTVAKSYKCYPSSENFGNKKKNHYEEDIFVGYR
ncbi:MAG: glycoside hydrolase family 3 C-terminal domain-containing protein, partial [Clostridia bacterium]|nr:glycoside hydrolase family 3 C-terminal domain-containing protein [Clostridia bacterium]